MTQITEQLHQLLELVLTELDRKAIPIAYMQEIDRNGKAFIEQAARRAPAAPVPQGWRYVPEVLTPEMKREFMDMLMDGIDIYMNSNDQIEIQTDAPRRIWKSILAAAPQPPACNPSMQPELATYSAPVQLPEPVAKVEDGGLKCHIPDSGYSLPVRYLQGTHKLYTEQQVRQLLAQHGIK